MGSAAGITERNPCPKCGKRSVLMAGIVLDLNPSVLVLVCWNHKKVLARLVRRNEEWGNLSDLKKRDLSQ